MPRDVWRCDEMRSEKEEGRHLVEAFEDLNAMVLLEIAHEGGLEE
jgi:hypothetical protein